MKKILTLSLLFLFSLCAVAQQQILLLTETFETGSNIFEYDSGGVGTNTGTNEWIINNLYDGQSLYPNTPPQDSIVSGQINNAPLSRYLHIHDSGAAGGVANANWNTANASDRFTFIKSPFCTLGMTDVLFTFFWICEGNTDAYGEVYYRIDGGPWTKTGQAKYNNQSKWKYEVIQDPAFENAQNLQLGFRWVNPSPGGATNVSFGVDDIIAVGTYDNTNNPVQVNIVAASDDTVCQGDPIVFSYQLSAPLCDGQYYIELSNKNGVFGPNANTNQFITIPANQTSGAFFMYAPDSLGNCFKVRLVRNTVPNIVGGASPCFTVIDCPESIITLNAPVMNDVDTTCILSVIDVKFNSFGFFNIGNSYIAELSDTNGASTPFFLGSNPTNKEFPSFPPGNVSGLIPQNAPPGCGYYIRVRSTSPAVVGTVIGPFCLVRCDEITNNHTDIQLCVPDSIPFPSCTTLNIDPNYWTNQASYDTCNDWTIELRDMMTFNLVNSGGLGVYSDSIGGNFPLCLPAVAPQLPVPPGTYYMRIVSNCSNQTWNQTGSVIRITIGAPDQNPPTIVGLQPDTVFCNAGIFGLQVVPYNMQSKYFWSSQIYNNGNEFETQPPQLFYGDLTGATPGDYIFYVRESNFGCYGPFSDPYVYTIITLPSVDITGPAQVCVGDTVNFFVDYLKETYYNWEAPAGVRILDEANSQVVMIFDSVGSYTISNFSLNDCGADSGTFTIDVVTLYSVNAGPDLNICNGESVNLIGKSSDLDKVFVTQDTATQGRQGAMFNIVAQEDVIIDSFAVKYLTTQPIQAEIYGKAGSYRTFEQQQFSWNQIGAFFNFTPAPLGQMTVIPIEINTPINKGDTFAFYITTANTPALNMAYNPGIGLQQGTVYKSDGVIDFIQGTINNYPFGAFTGPRVLNCKIYYSTKAGLKYLWNTGDTTSILNFAPSSSGMYSVLVYDTSGCRNMDSVYVKVNPLPIVNAGSDTLICDGETYQLLGSSTQSNILWSPATGLDNVSSLNPLFNNSEGVEFTLTATDSIGCRSSDTVFIDVKNCDAFIEIPQAFTPNSDGQNDYFTIFADASLITDYEIRIYNRWGELVYSSSNLSDLETSYTNSKGWDGTYKGKLQNVGTFAYYLTAKDVYGKQYEKKGNITLIR
ncbi:MAG: gliding motility-associated C-terminal domain-containing protein [Bacteroidetes bacterium]|nr:gliding motility-associated C-terminal domain-containing protein [Bacteroidota bacterium]